jgi:hypothetical protein
MTDRALTALVVRAHALEAPQHGVDDLAGRQLDEFEDRLGIAVHVGRQDDVALHLRLDASNVVCLRAGSCRRLRILLRIAYCFFALGLGLQFRRLACLPLACLGDALLLVLLLLVGFLLLALDSLGRFRRLSFLVGLRLPRGPQRAGRLIDLGLGFGTAQVRSGGFGRFQARRRRLGAPAAARQPPPVGGA